MGFTRISTVLLPLIALTLTGCRAHLVDTTISNRTSAPVTLIELDYPSASFGIQSIAAASDYRYSFSVIGSGPLKLHYTDAAGKDHTSTGPTLSEGTRGPLHILITPSEVQWQAAPALHATPTPAR